MGNAIMGNARKSAVVLGAGMAGLLAARVVSEHYDSVTVIERDPLPDQPNHRKGVPQGRHLHSFLTRGTAILGELFPGILDELVAAGAVVIDNGDLSGRYTRIGRHELNPAGRLSDPEALAIYSASRPFVEFHVRRRVNALSNVAVLDEHDALALIGNHDAVTGVRIANRKNKLTQLVHADLVIDATGRTSHCADFLAENGFGPVPTQRHSPTWAYSSQLLRLPPGRLADKLVFVDRGRCDPGLLLVAYEHDTWMLSVARHRDHGSPPRDFSAMMAVAEQALPEPILAGLREAAPVGDIAVAHDTAQLWHRYDHMSRTPAALVVIGDSLCRVNPLHGQGMTLAALQSLTLRDCLRESSKNLAQRYFRASATAIQPVWAANASYDRPASPSRRDRVVGQLRSWITDAVGHAASRDVTVTERFMRVRNLVDSPAQLRDPVLLSRIVLANLRSVAVPA